MNVSLGINTCFAVKRWPEPADWARLVRDELGLDLVQHSLDLVELGAPDETLLARQAAHLKDACAAHGLTLESTFTGLAAYSSNILLHPDAAVRQAWRRWYDRVLAFTAAAGGALAGGHVAAFSLAQWRDPVAREAGWRALAAELRELAGTAHALGLQGIYIENLASAREPATMAQVERLLDDGGAEHVPIRLCLDVGHQVVPGTQGEERDPYAWLRHFGVRLGAVHIQQSDAEGDHHWPFTATRNAQGRIDAARVLATLSAARADDVKLFLEVIPPFEQDDDEVLADLVASVAYWRAAIRDYAATAPPVR
jgi:D-erythrulose 1-phosphate 3-epimerase